MWLCLGLCTIITRQHKNRNAVHCDRAKQFSHNFYYRNDGEREQSANGDYFSIDSVNNHLVGVYIHIRVNKALYDVNSTSVLYYTGRWLVINQ